MTRLKKKRLGDRSKPKKMAPRVPSCGGNKRNWNPSIRLLIEVLQADDPWRCQGDGYCESTCAPNEKTEGSPKAGRQVRRVR